MSRSFFTLNTAIINKYQIISAMCALFLPYASWTVLIHHVFVYFFQSVMNLWTIVPSVHRTRSTRSSRYAYAHALFHRTNTENNNNKYRTYTYTYNKICLKQFLSPSDVDVSSRKWSVFLPINVLLFTQLVYPSQWWVEGGGGWQ